MLKDAGHQPLGESTSRQFELYLELIMRWNSRTNLTAIRNAEGILRRHFVESIACAEALPVDVTTLLDYGSGAGFPGIPIALCRPGVAVTLAESQNKKAAFLEEVVRSLGLHSTVFHGRAESIQQSFDVVVLRAVDRMGGAIAEAINLVRRNGWLCLMTTIAAIPSLTGAAGSAFRWDRPIPISRAEQQVIALGRKV
jgi:16S rRNA (guanine527-N7)-methyltransferase